MARPEILTKSFGPPVPEATTSSAPPEVRVGEGEGVPLRSLCPHRGPSWGPRPGWGRGRPARRPRGLHPRPAPPGTGDWSKVPGVGLRASRGRAFHPKHAHPRARGPPSAHGGRPRRQGPGLLGRDEGQGLQPPRSGQALAAAPAPAGETPRAGPTLQPRGAWARPPTLTRWPRTLQRLHGEVHADGAAPWRLEKAPVPALHHAPSAHARVAHQHQLEQEVVLLVRVPGARPRHGAEPKGRRSPTLGRPGGAEAAGPPGVTWKRRNTRGRGAAARRPPRPGPPRRPGPGPRLRPGRAGSGPQRRARPVRPRGPRWAPPPAGPAPALPSAPPPARPTLPLDPIRTQPQARPAGPRPQHLSSAPPSP